MCDFAVGLSRQLYGLTIASERSSPPHDRAMATAGADRNHHGVQFPGGGLGLERGARGRLRRHDGLEAVAADALCARSPCRRSSTRSPSERMRGSLQSLHRRRRGHWRDHACRRATSADFRDRKLPDGPASGRGRRPPTGPHDPRAWRQQCDHHHARAPTSSWPSARPRSRPSGPRASVARRCAA